MIAVVADLPSNADTVMSVSFLRVVVTEGTDGVVLDPVAVVKTSIGLEA